MNLRLPFGGLGSSFANYSACNWFISSYSCCPSSWCMQLCASFLSASICVKWRVLFFTSTNDYGVLPPPPPPPPVTAFTCSCVTTGESYFVDFVVVVITNPSPQLRAEAEESLFLILLRMFFENIVLPFSFLTTMRDFLPSCSGLPCAFGVVVELRMLFRDTEESFNLEVFLFDGFTVNVICFFNEFEIEGFLLWGDWELPSCSALVGLSYIFRYGCFGAINGSFSSPFWPCLT